MKSWPNWKISRRMPTPTFANSSAGGSPGDPAQRGTGEYFEAEKEVRKILYGGQNMSGSAWNWCRPWKFATLAPPRPKD